MKNLVFTPADNSFSVAYKTDLTTANPSGQFTVMSSQSTVTVAGKPVEHVGVPDAIAIAQGFHFKPLAKYKLKDFIALATAKGLRLVELDNSNQVELVALPVV